jgi:hypothetical protein
MPLASKARLAWKNRFEHQGILPLQGFTNTPALMLKACP